LSDAQRRFRLFLAIFTITGFSNFYFLLGPFLEGRGFSPRYAGLALSLYFAATVAFRPFGARALEGLGTRRTLIASGGLCALGGALMALGTDSPALVLLSRALMGVGTSAYGVGVMAYQGLIVSEESRGSAFALLAAGSMAPQATVVPLAEWLLARGWEGAFLWGATAMAVGAALLGAWCVPRGDSGRPRGGEGKEPSAPRAARRSEAETLPDGETWGSYGDLFRSAGVRLLLLTALAVALSDAMTLVTPYLARERGLRVSWFMAASATVAILIRTLGFRLMDRFPRTRTIAPALGMMSTALIGTAFARTDPVLALWGGLFGLGIGIGFPTLLSLVGDLLPHRLRPKGTASVLLIYDAGWMLTPLFYGLAAPRMGTLWSFLAAGLLGLVAAAGLNRHLRRMPRSRPSR